MGRIYRLFPGFVALCLYLAAISSLDQIKPTGKVNVEPVFLPLPIQMLMSGGDHFLAANVGMFRAMVELADVTEANGGVTFVAKLQSDVAWLNPGHEDNYYLAAGLLSGGAQHDIAQSVLSAASNARPFDFQPPFFYSFNLMYYERRYEEAATWMHMAAEREDDERNRAALTRIAVRWAQRGEDPAKVAEMLEAMAKTSRGSALQEYTLKRAQQARQLAALSDAVRVFSEKKGRIPTAIDELVAYGVIDALPEDPVGAGFELDSTGRPVAKTMKKGAR